jgi:hypothetical protein
VAKQVRQQLGLALGQADRDLAPLRSSRQQVEPDARGLQGGGRLAPGLAQMGADAGEELLEGKRLKFGNFRA